MIRRALSVALLAGSLPGMAFAQVLLGPEFQVNTHTTEDQSDPSVAADAAGNFVAVWNSYPQDGDGNSVWARRYAASGTPLGPPFLVNTYTSDAQAISTVAGTPTGEFVVAWASYGQDGDGWGIFARPFDASGAPRGPEVPVNVHATSWQSQPSVGVDAGGNFVVAWQASSQDGDGEGIFARRFTAVGTPVGPELLVNSYTTGFQGFPDVAVDATGDFVIAWMSVGQDGSGSGVYAQRFDSAGSPAGSEFRVNTHIGSDQSWPAVGTDPGGNFVVAWTSYLQDGDYNGIYAKRYNAAGAPVSTEFRVNSYTTGTQQTPAITVDPRGNFVVAWESMQSGTFDIFARRFDRAGVAEGPEFRVNTYVPRHQNRHAITSDGLGNFVSLWTSNAQDGADGGVFGQRLAPDVIFKDGFEASDFALWSQSATDAGDLAPSIFAAMKGSLRGLRGLVDDTAGLYVQDDSPNDEGRYRARFYLDPNSFDPGEAQTHLRTRVFIAFSEAPTRRLVALVLRRQSGAYSLMARARRDDNSQANTGFFSISNAPHIVEIDLKKASTPDANDGWLQLWIDGSFVSFVGALDNSLSAVDFARLGALSVKTGAGGTIYWDEFESRRLNYVGP